MFNYQRISSFAGGFSCAPPFHRLPHRYVCRSRHHPPGLCRHRHRKCFPSLLLNSRAGTGPPLPKCKVSRCIARRNGSDRVLRRMRAHHDGASTPHHQRRWNCKSQRHHLPHGTHTTLYDPIRFGLQTGKLHSSASQLLG